MYLKIKRITDIILATILLIIFSNPKAKKAIAIKI